MYGPGQSNAVTADGAVKTSNGRLSAVLLTAAAATATIILYDNASAASGTILASLSCVQNTSTHVTFPHGLVFSNGIYADIGGAGAAAYVVTA